VGEVVKKIISVLMLFIMTLSYLLIPQKNANAFAPALIEWAAATIVANGGAFSVEQGINPTCETFLEDLQQNATSSYEYLEAAALVGSLYMNWELSQYTQGWLQQVKDGDIPDITYNVGDYEYSAVWQNGTGLNRLTQLGTYKLQFIGNSSGATDMTIYYYDVDSRNTDSAMNICFLCDNTYKVRIKNSNGGYNTVYVDYPNEPVVVNTDYTWQVEITEDNLIVTTPNGGIWSVLDNTSAPYYGITGIVSMSGAAQTQDVYVLEEGPVTVPVTDLLDIDPEKSSPTYITNNVINHYVELGTGGTALENANNPELTDDPPPIAYPNTTLDQTILNKILTAINGVSAKIGQLSNALTIDLVGNIALVDATPITLAFANVTGVYPFSIPWDVKRSIEALGSGSETVPRIQATIPYSTLGIGAADYVFDQPLPTMFVNLVVYLRWAILLGFDISLLYALYKWMGAAT
jgi:hypothetical protein